MSFDPFKLGLPVAEALSEIRQKLADSAVLIVNAPAGAGKSTLLPLALYEEPWLAGKKILMLEPRRLAAKTIAWRMASLLGEELGETVGYRIRFERKISERTRIEVLTEGILTRMLQSDSSLEGVGMVIFDEFHERSIHADVALAFCREAQQILRPDLRIMIMSATLDMPQLTDLLNAPAVTSAGRQYPVEIVYTGDQDEFFIPELTARTILKAVRENAGDLLAFLPGEAEIRKCESILKQELKGFIIYPLYGQLPPSKQAAAISPDKKGRRKIVLATSIAETSLTIEGVSIVVDSGYGRTLRFDPNTALSRLETIRISKDSADQRAGRAGRLGPGVCYRMWSKATHERMADHRTPEILEADLASLALDLAQWGVDDPGRLAWLNPPPKGTLQQAQELLHQLNALENGRITPHGRKIQALPCHPRLAHMLLLAEEQGKLSLAADLAAILEERDPLAKEAGIDINLRIEALRRFRQGKGEKGRFSHIAKAAASYRQLFHAPEDNGLFDPYDTGLLLAQAYPERIAYARPGTNARFQMANGRHAVASHKDDLAHESWLSIAHVDARDGMGKIFLASPLNPRDLEPLVKEQESITWDTRKGGLIASKDLRIGSIVLLSKPLPSPNMDKVIEAVSEAVKNEGETLLNFSEEVVQLQNRILSLRHWRPGENWPDVGVEYLLKHNKEWLAPYLAHVKKPEDIKRINLREALLGFLDYDKHAALDRLAPERLVVPSGSAIRLTYSATGEPPVMAVRLQEVFGMAETPKVNEGRTPVVMHLLSPGFKPVQVTSDLRSFWNNAYFEVRKELKRRYPKHAWPDDPWTEKPLRGAKRRQP